MRHVEEDKSPRGDQEQGSEQSERLMDVIFWLFAPRNRLFNVCRAKPSAWDNVRNCAGTCGCACPSKL
eukprot:5280857-Lingulodinium_polyedra.AAC.1